MQTLLYKGAVYREAGIYDTVVEKLLAPLWNWIAKLGWSKNDVINYFDRLFSRQNKTANKTVPKLDVPDFIDAWIVKTLVATGMDKGQFMLALHRALDKERPGFDWQKVGQLGQQKLVRIGPEGDQEFPQFKPAPIISGDKFDDTILISVWWATEKPDHVNDITLRAYIESNAGDVFWRVDNAPEYETQTQFGGFIIVPRTKANEVAADLCKLVKDAARAGNSPSAKVEDNYRLAAVYLSGLVDGQPITNGDIVNLGCINSVKFNWVWTLPDILMGRVQEFRKNSTSAYQKFVAELEKFVSKGQ